ncbi:carbohydrate ABC transporter permease [Halogeometricum limi]|uniref:Lactose/L-arabinose transport system permease protein n=1 Tax=Halogeometricum limi TaxID=555875 RepID=A0A1I6IM42_9EURY|nr:carbohydrate ABC transporter permease [Halogeometricum limi]SFR67786.1 lactose/L-arabinose transport system permease protein [Halogeometricum limi]
MREETRREAVWQFLTYSFIVLGAVVTLVPLYWIFVASTLSESEFLSSTSPRLVPGGEFFSNLQALQARENVQILGHVGQMTQYVDLGPVYFAYDFWHLWNPGAIENSIFIAVAYTLLSLVLCSMAGFAFAKYEFRFKKPMFYAILATLILPIQLLVIPLFLLMSQLNMTNTYWAIILPWAANPLGIFLMRQNMRSIPDALLESARMDGATEFQLYYKIALPTMKSSLAALAIILFLFQWNLFLFPLVILEQGKYTIPVAINQLVGAQRVYYDQIMVAATLSIVPIFVLFLFLQKQFVSGILAGSVKE